MRAQAELEWTEVRLTSARSGVFEAVQLPLSLYLRRRCSSRRSHPERGSCGGCEGALHRSGESLPGLPYSVGASCDGPAARYAKRVRRLAADSALMMAARCYALGVPHEVCRPHRPRIRHWTVADIPRLFTMYSDPKVTHHQGALYVTRVEEVEARHPDLISTSTRYGMGCGQRSDWTAP